MTQKQGYVWFLPGWYEDRWYDIDHLKSSKNNHNGTWNSTYSLFAADNKKTTIDYDTYSNVGKLPDCTTEQMLEVSG